MSFCKEFWHEFIEEHEFPGTKHEMFTQFKRLRL